MKIFYLIVLLLFMHASAYAEKGLFAFIKDISKEEAVAMAQKYAYQTKREQYWKINEPIVKIRENGKFQSIIWDIKFPPIEDGWGMSKLDPKKLRPMHMMPFMMIINRNTGDMKYNEIKISGGKINVILMDAKIE